MAGEINITVVGNAVEDPELRFTPGGAAVAKFRIASTPRTYDKQQSKWVDGESTFLSCSVWRQAAEHVAESVTRGTRLVVTGRLKQRSYEGREGQQRTVYELDCDEVAVSLTFATAKVNKMGRTNGNGQQASPQAAAPAGGDPWATSTPPTRNGGGFDEQPPF